MVIKGQSFCLISLLCFRGHLGAFTLSQGVPTLPLELKMLFKGHHLSIWDIFSESKSKSRIKSPCTVSTHDMHVQ